MKTMTIRNIPDDVYDGIKEMARYNQRSLQEQVMRILTHEVQLHRPSICEQAAAYRTRLSKRTFKKTSLADLREDQRR